VIASPSESASSPSSAAAVSGSSAGAFWAGAAFFAAVDLWPTGADFLGLVFVAAAFLVGALVAVFVWVVVFLRAVEDTNTSRQGDHGRGKARFGQEPRPHSAMALVAAPK
jgi:hypothetical protein